MSKIESSLIYKLDSHSIILVYLRFRNQQEGEGVVITSLNPSSPPLAPQQVF